MSAHAVHDRVFLIPHRVEENSSNERSNHYRMFRRTATYYATLKRRATAGIRGEFERTSELSISVYLFADTNAPIETAIITLHRLIREHCNSILVPIRYILRKTCPRANFPERRQLFSHYRRIMPGDPRDRASDSHSNSEGHFPRDEWSSVKAANPVFFVPIVQNRP